VMAGSAQTEVMAGSAQTEVMAGSAQTEVMAGSAQTGQVLYRDRARQQHGREGQMSLAHNRRQLCGIAREDASWVHTASNNTQGALDHCHHLAHHPITTSNHHHHYHNHRFPQSHTHAQPHTHTHHNHTRRGTADLRRFSTMASSLIFVRSTMSSTPDDFCAPLDCQWNAILAR
jgi:hypothetical protein